MIPSFGMRIMLVLIVCAPAAGVFIAYAEGGTSLWTALAFAVLDCVLLLVADGHGMSRLGSFAALWTPTKIEGEWLVVPV